MRNKRAIAVFFFKLLISLSAFYFIYLKIINSGFSKFVLPAFNFQNIFLLFFSLILMPLNWFTESVKWKFIIRKIKKTDKITAFKSVISGIPFALFTPAGSGEIIGRTLQLEKRYRKKAVLLTALGSYAQLTATIIAGFTGGIILMFFFNDKIHLINPELFLFFKVITVLLFLLSILFIFNLNVFTEFLKKMRISEKYYNFFKILSSYTGKEIRYIIFLSLLRYLIFSLQFYLLLLLFEVNINLIEAFTGISLSFLVSSLIPVFRVFEIGIRGSTAIIFIGLFTVNLGGIISAVSVLWLINLLLPSLWGIIIFNKTEL